MTAHARHVRPAMAPGMAEAVRTRPNANAAIALDFADDLTKLMPENSSARSPPLERSQVRQETFLWVGGTAVPARNVASGEHKDGP